MKKIAVVYHSGFGHTKKLAQAVARGAESVKETEANLIPVEEVDQHWDALNESDAIIFGSPTYMGSVSAPFKEFMDKSGKVWFEQKWKDKLAAGFTNSGSMSGDKFNVLVQLATLAAQHSMIWVSLGLLPGARNGDPSLNRIGSFLGAMAQSDDDGPEVTPPQGDLLTAEHLGRRVAILAQQNLASKQLEASYN